MALIEIVYLFYWLITGKEVIIVTFGSYGDLMMANGVLNYYAVSQQKRLRVVYKKKELLADSNCLQKCLTQSKSYYLAIWLSAYAKQFIILNYGTLQDQPEQHLMQRMANKLQMVLPTDFVPYINLNDQPLFQLNLPINKPIVVIQSTANPAFSPNKQWDMNKMIAVVESVKKKAFTIQIGPDTDIPLPVDASYLGKTTFKQSISIIKQSNLFVGLEGALMHGAAAVSTPSVIVFGGYIHHHQSGYHTTHAVQSAIECAPCLLTTPCPINLQCMRGIEADAVIYKIDACIN
ncbi:MAG: hypothetical protein MUE96_03730 [Bacteroidia bacterium]|jgi:ADP-heptose:LPS heptosyltransferase|nr:hypothetical protein [Bacteroidia bacterium]